MSPRSRSAGPAVAALACLVLVTSCGKWSMFSIEQVELHRSAPQHLMLRNGGGESLFVVPVDQGNPPLQVDPGSSTTIDFVVATIVEVEDSPDQPWLAALEGTERDVAIMVEPEGYLEQSGPDLTFRVRDGDPARERRLSLQCGASGWGAAAAPEAEHGLDLAAPPLAGVPDRICPK